MANRVGFGPRLAAYLIDGVIVWCAIIAVYVHFGNELLPSQEMRNKFASLNPFQFAADPEFSRQFGLPFIMAYSLPGAVYALIEGLTGASPAKRLLGLAIGTADGTRTTRRRIFLRTLLKNLWSFTSPLVYLVPIPQLFRVLQMLGVVSGQMLWLGHLLALGEDRQALHDMVCKTAVYRKKELR